MMHFSAYGLPRLKLSPLCVLLAATTLLSGCAGYQAYRDGQAQIEDGEMEAGLSKLNQAMALEPANVEYRRTFFRQRETLVNAMTLQAQQAVDAGDFASAREAYAKALALEPSNKRLVDGQSRIDLMERHSKAVDAAAALAKAGKLDAAIADTQKVLAESPGYRKAVIQLRQLLRQQADTSGKDLGIYPKLKAAYRVPVTLSLTNASLLQVFEALKQASGLNYIIEKDVKPDLRVTIAVTNKPVEDILRLLLATNQLERRILDEDTVLIYPNTPAKATEYREMVVRTFYLTNADATKVAAMVKTIAKARDVVVDEKLNMIAVRDSAEIIRMAEKLIATQDIPEPEVMLELEVLEVSVTRLLQMGIRWPDSISAGVIGADGVSGQLRLNELRNSSSSMVKLNFSDPIISAQLRSTKGNANLLANPRVRVKNKQAAKILIGERLPVITTTTTANVGASNSVSYLDVGLKLDIEPAVSLDDEVSMKIALEVSNVLGTLTTSTGTQAYHLGTRNTSTSLRVRDGETNILAGLIQREERRANTGVPGLNEVPVVSKLFGSANDTDNKTEIVLLITPHIVRNVDVPGVGVQEFLAGTDSALGARPIQLGQSEGALRNAGAVMPSPPSGMPAPVLPALPGASNNTFTNPAALPRSAPVMAAPYVPGQPPAQQVNPPALVAPPMIPTSP